ncbi:HAMP domain-containing histidine kinase [Streptomyces jumonjinensis]|uniref:histidine kinase n=2 Tax=Streptomyces jumonjinensis TaxID=1945 RepID=A0A646KIR4_STRJU|nr:HAMP domain-containing histidine kinase [Streptomyces jumonjinensis]
MPRRVRMRLTLLYGSLFVALGAVLLTITYLLVSSRNSKVIVRGPTAGPTPDSGVHLSAGTQIPSGTPGFAQEEQRRAMRARAAEVQDLLMDSGTALAIMSVIAIGLGWVVAGRVLRPLRTMTTTIQRISAHNVHERLAMKGPGDELTDLADTVDGLLGRLEKSLDSHKRFVANAAHELRTPLTVEHALLEEALIDRDATVDSFRSNFERLLVLSEQQARLLESLLTLSSSERGLDRREPLELDELAGQLALGCRQEAERRGLRLKRAIEPAGIWGDSALVERLLANLLNNAMGYNAPDGWVEVTTWAKGGHAVVRVANTGPRIPAERVSQLLEPFQRLGRTAGDGHHGLGLSIVRSIAAAHDATLSVYARPEGGFVVEVAFPLRTADRFTTEPCQHEQLSGPATAAHDASPLGGLRLRRKRQSRTTGRR